MPKRSNHTTTPGGELLKWPTDLRLYLKFQSQPQYGDKKVNYYISVITKKNKQVPKERN